MLFPGYFYFTITYTKFFDKKFEIYAFLIGLLVVDQTLKRPPILFKNTF